MFLYLSIIFFIIAVAAAFAGFPTIALASASVSKTLFLVFLAFSGISILLHFLYRAL